MKRGKIYGACHKCPHNATAEKIRRGEAVTDADRQQAADACAACTGAAENSNRGISWVYLEGMIDPHKFLEDETDKDYLAAKAAAREAALDTEPQLTNAPREVETAMLAFLRDFSALSLSAAIALHAMLNRRTLAETAKATGRTKQALSKAFSEACAKCPVFAALAPKVIQADKAKSPARHTTSPIIRTAN